MASRLGSIFTRGNAGNCAHHAIQLLGKGGAFVTTATATAAAVAKYMGPEDFKQGLVHGANYAGDFAARLQEMTDDTHPGLVYTGIAIACFAAGYSLCKGSSHLANRVCTFISGNDVKAKRN